MAKSLKMNDSAKSLIRLDQRFQWLATPPRKDFVSLCETNPALPRNPRGDLGWRRIFNFFRA
jgi:hypothetical protein